MSADSVIFLAEINLSQLDFKSAVQAAVSPSPFVVPEEKVTGERGEESPVGGLEGPIEVGGVCETEAGTEVDAEDEDEDVDVVGGVDEVGLSGYESEGFTLSEILRRKRLGKNVSEGVIDNAHLPQCEFSNLHWLPLALLFRISLLASQLIPFGLILLRALSSMKMTSWGCCVLVYNCSGEPVVHGDEPELPRTDVSGSEFEAGAPTSEEEAERKKSQTKRAPKSPLTAVLESWLLSILHCRFLSYQWLIPCVISRRCWDDSGSIRKWRSVDWRGDGWAVEGASHCCYQEPGTVGWGAQHDVLEAVHSRCRRRELLERAFDDGNSCARMRNLLVLFQVGSKFLPCFFLLQISSWPIPLPLWFVPLGIKWCPCVAPFARRRRLSCCLLWWTVSIFRLLGSVVLFQSIFSVFLLVELNEVLDRLNQGSAKSTSPHRVETSDTSGDETDATQGRRKVLSKKTYRMKKVYAATELGRFFLTGPLDAVNLPSHFYCRLCRKNVSVLTHGHHEVLRYFQGRRHFARDQRLRLETPWWRALDFQGNPLTCDELEQQREKIQKGPLVVRDREHPFAEDFISDEAGVIDPHLPVLTKVSCLIDGLKMGGSYGLIEKLWAQFVLTTRPVKREVAWTRDEVLVGSVDFRNLFVSFLIHIVVLLLVNYHYWNANPNFITSC